MVRSLNRDARNEQPVHYFRCGTPFENKSKTFVQLPVYLDRGWPIRVFSGNYSQYNVQTTVYQAISDVAHIRNYISKVHNIARVTDTQGGVP